MKKSEINITSIKQYALKKGGQCLSDSYENGRIKLVWRCAKGHLWSSSVRSVIGAESWCPVCASNLPLSIKEMRVLASTRGGKCLSKSYKNSKTKLLWECSFGHRWESTPFSIKTRQSWCPFCAQNRPYKLKGVQKLVEKLGGECLSKKYVNVKSSLLWKCKQGHIWESATTNIIQGRWCPVCSQVKNLNKKKLKDDIQV